MSPSPFRFRPTLVNPPSRSEPLPVFDVPYYSTSAETLAETTASGHHVFTTICNDSVWHTIERLKRLNF